MVGPDSTLKRKPYHPDEANLKAKRPRKAIPPSPPKSFLSLPSELRQQIILFTKKPLIFEQILRETEWPEFQVPDDIFDEYVEEIRAWKETLLKAHPTIENDVLWVFEKWVESFEAVERDWAEYLGGESMYDEKKE